MKHGSIQRTIRLAAARVAILALLFAPLGALADEHDPSTSGHPLKVVGTILYPVGWLLDTILVRPLHWFAHLGPVSTLIGHESDSTMEADDD